jgi:acyl-CoA thioesterase-1
MFSIIFRSLFLLAIAAPAAAAAAQTVLVFGDSLSAGFGIAVEQSWPALLGKRLADKRPAYTVANASISGETTSGGRSRLPAALDRFRPAVVVVALGANDGLRGLPVQQMRANLEAMIRAAKARQARVLLVGMKLPPNYGTDYTAAFEQTYRSVARQEKVALLPFLLEPVVFDAGAFLPDGLHPSAAAQPKILEHVWKALAPLLK